MKKLIILLVLLTACSLQSTVPSGDSGKITVHMKLVKLPDDKGDTLQCIIYSLSNDSGMIIISLIGYYAVVLNSIILNQTLACTILDIWHLISSYRTLDFLEE